MSEILQQAQAESIILSYKLDKIRKHINNRLINADPIVKNELLMIQSLISQYETVPSNWKLETSIVEIPNKEEE